MENFDHRSILVDSGTIVHCNAMRGDGDIFDFVFVSHCLTSAIWGDGEAEEGRTAPTTVR